ncbi:MAG: hypothetical protein NTY23_11585, partial [Chloroflexi bacterium]|nr:hypothetical protein [Chloroflexota bacterium]
DTEGWRVPQRDLIGVVQLLLQQGRLDLPKRLPETPALVGQLDAWRATAGFRGRDRYELGGEDDLVTALALACWWGQLVSPARVEADPDDFSAWGPEALKYEYDKRRIKGGPAKPTGPMADGVG